MAPHIGGVDLAAHECRRLKPFQIDRYGRASVKVTAGSPAASDKCASPFMALSVSIASRA